MSDMVSFSQATHHAVIAIYKHLRASKVLLSSCLTDQKIRQPGQECQVSLPLFVSCRANTFQEWEGIIN